MNVEKVVEYQPDGTMEDYVSFLSSAVTAKQAKKLLEILKDTPNDLPTRLLLLEYFLRQRVEGGAQRKKADEPLSQHLLWLIDNHPRHIILGHLFGLFDDEYFRKARSRWLREVRLHPSNVAILYHASQFCRLHAPSHAEKLLKRATVLDPNNDMFPFYLANFYVTSSYRLSGSEQRRLAVLAIKFSKMAIERYAALRIDYTPLEYDYDLGLEEVANLAIRCKLFDSANELAALLMDRKAIETKRGRASWLTDEGLARRILVSKIKAHAIYGRVALAKKDRANALCHLERIIDLHDHSLMKDLTLANALLKKGETEIVLKFLRRMKEATLLMIRNNSVREDGDAEDEELQFWIDEVEQGRKPTLRRG